ncbi:MAG: V-type ATP synthase subunit I [Ectothiorhodospiraceae bacterium]|nr:V-type ATP synthase subunit I [Ectothiorhodospiraceae bacterium]
MAIVQLQKLTIYGASEQKQALLDQLQQLGCVHLLPLRELPKSTRNGGSLEAIQAYRYLMRAPLQRRPATDASRFDRKELVKRLLSIKDRHERLQEERDEIQHAIEMKAPWGEFRLPDQEELAGYQLFFFQVPLRDQDRMATDDVVQIIKRDNRFAYVVVVAEQAPSRFVGNQVVLDSRPLSELHLRIDQIGEELEELHWQRTTLTRWSKRLRDDLDAAADQADKEDAAHGLWTDEHVFALQGWVPKSAARDIEELARRNNLAIVLSEPRRDETPPTLLKNPERIAGAENLVTFYITPGYQSWDPTTIVFLSFSLFFAMIIADAGYGFVMALLIVLGWRWLSQQKSGAPARNLLIGIASVTIAYGVVVGSYFGTEPKPGTFLDSLRIRLDGKPMMEDQNAMMAIAVAIGVIHLSLANVITAFRSHGQLRSIGHLAWAMVMIGAFLIGLGSYSQTDALRASGVTMASLGGVLVLLFSSQRPWLTRDWKAYGMRLVDGLMQVANLSKAFGDVLSYLRLFALGLASAQLAITFNSMAAGVYERGGIGILFAIVILLIGHGINFLLGLVGGVVHGLRLNCIEFFNWGLSQEGYAFQPFRKRAER